MFHPASVVSLIAFVGICLFVVGAVIWGVWKGAGCDSTDLSRRSWAVAIGMVVYLSAIIVVVASGWPRGNQQRLLLFFGMINVISLIVGLSTIGRWLSLLPLSALVVFQGFRLPLELVLHSWVLQGVIPPTMTWSGRNWDIVSGIVALLMAPACRPSKWPAWIANIIGLALLVNVMRVAILSSPVSFGWPVTPKIELINHGPYALIVPVCIGSALIGHIALTRALLRTTR
jgi:hypothetical protein